MGWIDSLRGQVIAIDSAPFIYYIEAHPTYIQTVRPFFDGMRQGEFQGVTSVVALLELLVNPLRRDRPELAEQYRNILLHSDNVTCTDFSPQIAELAAKLRSEHTIRTPDAIHLATALHARASHFLTNDARLPSLPSLEILILDRLIPH